MPDADLELSVTVDSNDEDVLLVTYHRPDGLLYRGALLKVKSWPCPNLRPTQIPSEESKSSPEDQSNSRLLQLSIPNGLASSPSSASIDSLNGGSSFECTTPANPVGAASVPPVKEDDPPGLTDFAALQYRWSYFQKNPPPLPKRNLPSKREKEKIEQVTKLRPRNFLCTRCKFALPGFTQPITVSAQASPASSAVLDTTSTRPPSNGGPSSHESDVPDKNPVPSLSPSHNRKRRLPLKRTSVARPPTEPTNGEVEDGFTSGDDGRPKSITRKLAPTKRSRLMLEIPDNANTLPATILPSPSGDGSLKVKFKLSLVPPTEVPKSPVKSRRAKASATVTAVSPAVQDEEEEDDFDLQPRLRIDVDNDERVESQGAVASLDPAVDSPPPTIMASEIPAVPVTPPRKKRTPRATKTTVAPASTPVPVLRAEIVEEKPRPADVSDPLNNGPKPVARPVERCLTKDGRTFTVGDIVWGKIVGYPWWPGQIRHIVVCDDPLLQTSAASPAFADPHQPPMLQYQEAQIEWYGQKASISYIEVNQLGHFGEEYGKKYKPKLRAGGYQEAVKLATQSLRITAGDEGGSGEEEEEEQDVLSEIISESRQRKKTAESSQQPLHPASATSSSNDIYDFPPSEEFLHNGRPANTA